MNPSSVNEMQNFGVVQSAVLMGLKTSAAMQLLGTSFAARMKPEFQEVALDIREKGFPRVLDVTNPALAKLPLPERLRAITSAGGAVVDRSVDGSGDYIYAVPSGEIKLPDPISQEFKRHAASLLEGQTRYMKALQLHEKAKTTVFGGAMGASEVPLHDALREFSKAALDLHTVRSGYYENVRKYLSDRSSLATRNYDVSEGEQVVRMDQSLNQFLRDCQLILKKVDLEVKAPGSTLSSPTAQPGGMH